MTALTFIAGDMLNRSTAGLAGELGKAALMHVMSAGWIDADRANMVQTLDRGQSGSTRCDTILCRKRAMTFTSPDAFRDFERSVQRDLRYVRGPAQEDFLATVIATTKPHRNVQIKAGKILWRAQLRHDWYEEKQGHESFDVPGAYYPERMKPIPDKAVDGRVNPKGIVCLYLATHEETAVLETRPLIGSYVSVAQFKVLRDVDLVDCSRDQYGLLQRIDHLLRNKPWAADVIERAVWSDINHAFSKPARRGDDSLDYVPTQILAEVFKRNEFGGIAYKSSYGEEGFNVALFDISAADPVNCALHRIDDVKIKTSQNDQYFIENGMMVRNIITEILPVDKN